jgi:hypothetical protein
LARDSAPRVEKREGRIRRSRPGGLRSSRSRFRNRVRRRPGPGVLSAPVAKALHEQDSW